jgi:hypothetical protein
MDVLGHEDERRQPPVPSLARAVDRPGQFLKPAIVR